MSPPDSLRFVVRLPCAPCGGTGNAPRRDPGIDERGIAPPPPDCEHCEGSGEIEESLTLGELRLLVADWMTSPIVPAGELDAVVDSLKASMTAAASRSQGLADADEVGSWLRACQEAAEALRAVAALRPRARDEL